MEAKNELIILSLLFLFVFNEFSFIPSLSCFVSSPFFVALLLFFLATAVAVAVVVYDTNSTHIKMKRICVEMPQKKNKRRIEGHDGHAEFI